MSIRHNILKILAEKGLLTLDEVFDLSGERDRRRVSDNLQACVSDGLVARTKDDVTHSPVYQITEKGRQRLAEGVGSMGGVSAMKRASASKQAAPRAEDQTKDDARTPTQEQESALLRRRLEQIEEMIRPMVSLDHGVVDAIRHLTENCVMRQELRGNGGRHEPVGYAVVDVNIARFDSQSEAFAAAQDAALDSRQDMHVVALLNTARVTMTPVVTWEHAQ